MKGKTFPRLLHEVSSGGFLSKVSLRDLLGFLCPVLHLQGVWQTCLEHGTEGESQVPSPLKLWICKWGLFLLPPCRWPLDLSYLPTDLKSWLQSALKRHILKSMASFCILYYTDFLMALTAVTQTLDSTVCMGSNAPPATFLSKMPQCFEMLSVQTGNKVHLQLMQFNTPLLKSKE